MPVDAEEVFEDVSKGVSSMRRLMLGIDWSSEVAETNSDYQESTSEETFCKITAFV